MAPRVSGRLEKLLVNVGDQVRNGNLVAVIEDEEFIQQAGQAEAELHVARANLEESASALDMARRQYERVKALREKKIVSQSDLDAAEAEYNARVAGHKVARAQVAEKEAALAASVALIPVVGVGFMPSADEGEVRVYGDMEVGTRLDVLEERFKAIEAIAREEVPEARSIMTRLGPSGWRGGGSHTGHIRIALKPESERSRSSHEIAASLRKRLSGIPGMKMRTRSVQELFALRLISGDSEDRVQVDIRGHDLERADALAEKVKAEVEKVGGITDVTLSREAGSPEELVLIDRQKAADMGLTVSQIADTLQTVLTGKVASYYRDAGEEVPIRVKLMDAERAAIGEVLDLKLTNDGGEQAASIRTSPRTSTPG